ncbi:hypothetical protein AGLY_005015, partial [Aphis glycines]
QNIIVVSIITCKVYTIGFAGRCATTSLDRAACVSVSHDAPAHSTWPVLRDLTRATILPHTDTQIYPERSNQDTVPYGVVVPGALSRSTWPARLATESATILHKTTFSVRYIGHETTCISWCLEPSEHEEFLLWSFCGLKNNNLLAIWRLKDQPSCGAAARVGGRNRSLSIVLVRGGGRRRCDDRRRGGGRGAGRRRRRGRTGGRVGRGGSDGTGGGGGGSGGGGGGRDDSGGGRGGSRVLLCGRVVLLHHLPEPVSRCPERRGGGAGGTVLCGRGRPLEQLVVEHAVHVQAGQQA